jgi:hypothetical protein
LGGWSKPFEIEAYSDDGICRKQRRGKSTVSSSRHASGAPIA